MPVWAPVYLRVGGGPALSARRARTCSRYCAVVRFSIVTAFQPADQLLALAGAADDLGYHAISVPDHVIDLEELSTPYPYTPDGARRWDIEAQWPDPWVLIGAMAARTSRERFFAADVIVPTAG